MSITKNQLKAIVKECLVEILAEGIGSSSINEIRKKPPLQQTPNQSTIIRQNAVKTKLQQPVNHALKEAIRRESGGNDIMASILADTAEKTLPTMLENERNRAPVSSGGVVERVVANTNPEDLFGQEAASKWADLAFTNISKK